VIWELMASAHEGKQKGTSTQVKLQSSSSKAYKNNKGPLRKLKELLGHQDWVQCLEISKNDKFLFSGGSDRLILVWNLNNYSIHQKIDNAHETCILSFQMTLDGNYLFSSGGASKVKQWIFNEKNKLVRFKEFNGHNSRVWCIVVGNKKKSLFSGGDDKNVIWWKNHDSNNLRERLVMSGHIDSIYSLALNKLEDFLFSGSADHTIRVWSLNVIPR
jgi:WD40 repeat protein